MLAKDHPAYRSALQFAEYVSAQQAALFVGAGLSRSAGYPDWKELLAAQAASLGLAINNATDLPALAQYAVNEGAGNKSLLENHISQQLAGVAPRVDELHRELARLPINTIWTTNYDALLEAAYATSQPDVKVGDKSLLTGVVSSRVTIYKMHGTITPHPSDIILTQDDYEHYVLRYPLMCSQLTSDFATKSFLFLGVSFTDTNVRHTVAQLRAFLRGGTRSHYLVFKTPEAADARQHYLWLRDLSRYGIIGLEVNDYSELPNLLRLIRSRSFPRSILVSGSHDGTDFEDLCSVLGAAIAARGLVLLSGEGRNVTTFVSEGAFNYLIDNGGDYYRQIQLFRVPQFARHNANERYRLGYRRQLTERARLAIIIAGGEGTMEEVRLCCDRQIPIVPLNWTGGTAETVWKQLSAGAIPYAKGLLNDTDMGLLTTKPSTPQLSTYVQKVIDLCLHLLANDIATPKSRTV